MLKHSSRRALSTTSSATSGYTHMNTQTEVILNCQEISKKRCSHLLIDVRVGVWPMVAALMPGNAAKVLREVSRVRTVTLKVGELQVVVVQRQVVLHGWEAARPGGEVSDTLVLTVQHLSEVICNGQVSDHFSAQQHNFEILRHKTCVC